MGYWQIVIPEASINEFADPHFFLSDLATGLSPWDLTGDGSGPSVAHTQDHQWKGPQAAELTFGSGGSYIQLEQDLELTTTDYYLSFVAQRAAGGAITSSHVRAMVDGSAQTPDSITALQDGWYRIEYTWTESSGGTIAVGGRALETGMILDAMQCEALDHRTTFIAGDQPGCQWLGKAYHSRSQRLASAREGGQVIDLADDYDLPVELSQGAGMPTIVVQAQDVIDGPALYLGSQAIARDLLVQIYAEGSDLAALRALRQDLISLIRPDSTAPQKPFLLRCSEAGDLRQIGCVYQAGLEGFQKNGYIESIALRLRALDPMWVSVRDFGASLDLYDADAGINVAVRGLGTGWADLGNTGSATVRALATAIDGRIVLAGTFTNMGGGTYNDYICLYDPRDGSFSPLERGLDGQALCCAVDALGDIWVGGLFSNAIDGTGSNVSNTAYLAKFDWSAQAWVSVGTGAANDAVNGLALNPYDGQMYAWGEFTTIGGVSAARIAYHNGTTFVALGTGLTGGGGSAYAVAWGLDGALYAGGQFSTAGGVTVDGFAKWDGSAWAACAGGLNGGATYPFASAILCLKDGSILLAGDFDDAGSVSGTDSIAIYEPEADIFLALADDDLAGATRIYALAYGPLGQVWIGGNFSYTSPGGLWDQDGLIRYDGLQYNRADVALDNVSNNASVYAFLLVGSEFYIAGSFDDAGSGEAWAGLTSITNGGSATTRPAIYITRSGGSGDVVLCSIRNDANLAELLFDCLILDGETITLDLRDTAEPLFMSDKRGSLWPFMGMGSDIASFALLPGANPILAFVNSSSVSGLMAWKEVYWSYD